MLMPKIGKVEFISTVKPIYDNKPHEKFVQQIFVNFSSYFSEYIVDIHPYR